MMCTAALDVFSLRTNKSQTSLQVLVCPQEVPDWQFFVTLDFSIPLFIVHLPLVKELIQCDMKWNDMKWNDMTWHDMTWHENTNMSVTCWKEASEVPNFRVWKNIIYSLAQLSCACIGLLIFLSTQNTKKYVTLDFYSVQHISTYANYWFPSCTNTCSTNQDWQCQPKYQFLITLQL